ncbi:hypothetical protein F441_20711 [Phytophthora nicotianae CJ01A1]|uniref:Uncharacterized protein n=2 Tax=Phytophthora nicotianae TaxID=4792 RepID=V9E1Z5_PHYNI|nr:hypothetical protein F443_20848 [Phytophthora nicotianae P1569]ETP02153.1 hypothetical protein F441_20711 [Phytophthora nicotianae CJ01A1]
MLEGQTLVKTTERQRTPFRKKVTAVFVLTDQYTMTKAQTITLWTKQSTSQMRTRQFKLNQAPISSPAFHSTTHFSNLYYRNSSGNLPNKLKPVMNCTKKPRKMNWYIKYIKRIESVCQPHVHEHMESSRVEVMVENRVWLKVKGSSTINLRQNVIKSMRDEAISWRELKFEVENASKCIETSWKMLWIWPTFSYVSGTISRTGNLSLHYLEEYTISVEHAFTTGVLP